MSTSTAIPRALLLLGFLLPQGAHAAAGAAAIDYPNRPVRLIVPQGIGAATDNIARVLGVRLGDALGQQVVVDNRPGASGLIGLELTARAAPDGYTLLATSAGIQPDVHTQVERQGAEPVMNTPAEFAKFMRDEWDRFGAAIEAAKLKAE